MVPGHGELNAREHHSRDYSAAHRRNLLLNGACCFLAAASVGCTRDASTANEASLALRTRVVTAGLPPDVSARAAAAIEAAVQRKSARAFEDDILRLEADHPGVGGAYWSEDGTMFVVHLTDVSSESHLRGAIARQLASWRVAPEMRRIALANLRVLPGRYTFSALVAWQQMLLEDSEARPLWNTLDADEVANRVRASVNSTEAVQQLEAVAERLGIPREGLLLRIEARPSPMGSVREKYRPVFGGLQVVNLEGGPTTWGICTLGWNVTNAGTGEEGFLTAGHCLYPPGVVGTGLLGARFTNNTAFDGALGAVRLNAPWQDHSLDPTCAGYALCTAADVIWIKHDYPQNSRHTVARTAYAGVGDGAGSISITGTFYPGAANYTIAVGGPLANKVGRLTGWTSGSIVQTCVAVTSWVDGQVALISCSHKASMRSGQGDSGAPVFYNNGSGSITPLGVLWGGPPLDEPGHGWTTDSSPGWTGGMGAIFCTLNCYVWFSDFQHIAMHLGTGFYPEYY